MDVNTKKTTVKSAIEEFRKGRALPVQAAQSAAQLRETLREILSVPTAPYQERWLRERIVARYQDAATVRSEVDQWGNLHLSYRPNPRSRARAKFALHAHLDHPGFCYQKEVGKGKGKGGAEILGGVAPRLVGGKIRFFPAPKHRGILATIKKVNTDEKGGRTVKLKHKKDIPDGCLGMWDFPALAIKKKFLEGRGFDDNLGVAILVAILDDAVREECPTAFEVLLTCAEEVGLVGAMALLQSESFKLPATILTLEMPGARGELVPGDGVIVRTGDSLTVYDPDLVLHLRNLASALQKEDPTFRFQRRLGTGGATEVTSFSLFGYQGAALCLPVINGHNINAAGCPAPERVHLGDLLSLVALLKTFIVTPLTLRSSGNKLKSRLLSGSREKRKRLR